MALARRRFESASAWYGVLGLTAAVLLCAQSVLAVAVGWRFDVSPVIVVFFAVELELIAGLILAFGVAYVADLLGGDAPGLVAAGYVAAYIVVRVLMRRSTNRSPPAIVALVTIAFVAALAARWGVETVAGPGAGGAPDALGRWAACVVLALPVYGLLRGVGDPFRPRDEMRVRR